MPVTPYRRRRRRRWILLQLVPALAGCGGSAPATWTASDDFNRAAGALGANWNHLSMGWTIIANQASAPNVDAAAHHVTVPTTADYWVQGTILPDPGGLCQPGLGVRMTDANNYYYLVGHQGTNTLTLRKRVASVETTIQTYVNAVWPILIRLDIAADQLTVTIAGAPQPAETDADLAGPGFAGIVQDTGAVFTGTVDDWSAGNT